MNVRRAARERCRNLASVVDAHNKDVDGAEVQSADVCDLDRKHSGLKDYRIKARANRGKIVEADADLPHVRPVAAQHLVREGYILPRGKSIVVFGVERCIIDYRQSIRNVHSAGDHYIVNTRT